MGIAVEYTMSVGRVLGGLIRRIGSVGLRSRCAIHLEVACIVVNGVVAVDIGIDDVSNVGVEESSWGWGLVRRPVSRLWPDVRVRLLPSLSPWMTSPSP